MEQGIPPSADLLLVGQRAGGDEEVGRMVHAGEDLGDDQRQGLAPQRSVSVGVTVETARPWSGGGRRPAWRLQGRHGPDTEKSGAHLN